MSSASSCWPTRRKFKPDQRVRLGNIPDSKKDNIAQTLSAYQKHLRSRSTATIAELMELTDHYTNNSKHDKSSQERINYEFVANYCIPNGWLLLCD